MNIKRLYRTVKLEHLILLLIMVLAYYLTFIPHQSYPYPVHLDEWLALGSSEALLAKGSFTVGAGRFLEAGFHLFWGIFYQISGISWLHIFRYFPGIVFIITILSVYILARREGFGWEAALFTSLIPTTVGILGPAFLVPLTIALPFIPLALFLAFNVRTVGSYVVLFIFISFLLLTHSVTAVGLVIVLAPYILFNLKSNFKHSLGIMLALGIPFLAPFPWIFNLLLPTAKSLFSPQPIRDYVQIPRIIKTYGYLPVLFAILGTFLLALRGGKKNYSLILGLLALIVMLAIFFTLHYGNPDMYYRGLMYMMLMLGIVAGAGLMGVRNLRLPARLVTWLRAPLIKENLGYILCLALIGLTLAIAIPAHQKTPYYHMIDEQDYQAFVWIRDTVDENYQKAILDPWKGIPFNAITQRGVYSAIKGYPKPSDEEAYEFLRDGCRDTDFLREKGISIIYTREQCDNLNLVAVGEGIYLLKETEGSE